MKKQMSDTLTVNEKGELVFSSGVLSDVIIGFSSLNVWLF